MFYLFHWFRSFLPLHNPIGFGAGDFIELAIGSRSGGSRRSRGNGWRDGLRRFAQRTGWCMAVLFVAPIALRLALLPLHPVPTALGSDDFSYLLFGDTLAHGRLANPVHPMHRFFETVFVLQEPSYSSIYPLGPALGMALGRIASSESVARRGDFHRRCFARCVIGCCARGLRRSGPCWVEHSQ